MLCDSITCIILLGALVFCNLDFKFPPSEQLFCLWFTCFLGSWPSFPFEAYDCSKACKQKRMLCNLVLSFPYKCSLCLTVTSLAQCKWSCSQSFFSLLFMWDTFSYQMPVQPAQQDSAKHGPHGEVLWIAGCHVSSWVKSYTTRANQNQRDLLLPSVPTFTTT